MHLPPAERPYIQLGLGRPSSGAWFDPEPISLRSVSCSGIGPGGGDLHRRASESRGRRLFSECRPETDHSFTGDTLKLLSDEVWAVFFSLDLFVCFVSTGEGGLEVCSHGCRPDLPVDVHYCVSVGDSRTLPASLALWDDLELSLMSQRIN